MSYQYSYILMDLGFLIIWILLFFWRKDLRKEMLFVSTPLGFMGPFLEFIYRVDWWAPLTITRTSLGIEDFLFGFAIGGISAVIYSDVFKKKIILKKMNKKKQENKKINFWFITILAIIIFYVIYYLLKLNTFIVTGVILLSVILTIIIKRKDLIINSLFSGISLLMFAFIVYTLTQVITPGWVEAFWHFKIIPKIIIFNLPLEEIVFYFLFGAAVGPLYEYWQEGKLINKK